MIADKIMAVLYDSRQNNDGVYGSRQNSDGVI